MDIVMANVIILDITVSSGGHCSHNQTKYLKIFSFCAPDLAYH